jgi:threonine/homoserine/homoserine lactone efflux protein
MILEFLIAAIIIELTPGPNMTWIALLAASRGRVAGLLAVAGIALGLTVGGAVAAFGFSKLIETNSNIFLVLRWAGTLYILYLAFGALNFSSEIKNKKFEATSLRYFFQGFLINILNPKAYLFYAAVLPQFIDSSKNIFSQLIMLTIIYIIVATLIHAIIAILAGKFTKFLTDTKRAKILGRSFAVLLTIVAIWFFISVKI